MHRPVEQPAEDQTSLAVTATVVVVIGGGPLDPSVVSRVPAGAHVIAADSGVDRALAVGWPVHEAVGDFDSVTAAGLDAAQTAGATIERFPVDKDATDLELAIEWAVARRPSSLVLVDGGGGRLDHVLANALVLTRPDLAPFDPTALVGPAIVTVVHGGRRREVDGAEGELVSLLPVHGDASGVTTTGLRWTLTDATLPAGSARGVSNRFVSPPATVAVASGVVMVVQPGFVNEDGASGGAR